MGYVVYELSWEKEKEISTHARLRLSQRKESLLFFSQEREEGLELGRKCWMGEIEN
jgi:hypothetical protein